MLHMIRDCMLHKTRDCMLRERKDCMLLEKKDATSSYQSRLAHTVRTSPRETISSQSVQALAFFQLPIYLRMRLDAINAVALVPSVLCYSPIRKDAVIFSNKRDHFRSAVNHDRPKRNDAVGFRR